MMSSFYYPINYTAEKLGMVFSNLVRAYCVLVITITKSIFAITQGALWRLVRCFKFKISIFRALVSYIISFLSFIRDAICFIPRLLIAACSSRKSFQYIYLRSSILQSLFSFRLCDENFDLKHDEPLTDIDQLANLLGLKVEHHEVQTIDGYVLGIQRLKRKIPQTKSQIKICESFGLNSKNSTSSSAYHQNKGTILLMHGTLQDSESFLCSGNISLAAVLCYEGYDVWLGNNRGTKYSNYHETLEPDQHHYWDFCLDDLAQFDLPAMMKYVLQESAPNSSSSYSSSSAYSGLSTSSSADSMTSTSCISPHTTTTTTTTDNTNNNDNKHQQQKQQNQQQQHHKISIIGFSQGATQTFLALSMYPNLCKYINIFISLAPALKSKDSGHTILHAFMRSNYLILGSIFKLFFGDKSIVTFFLLFKNIMSRKLFCIINSIGAYLCIGWKFKNINFHRRKDLFQYTYSETSVKCAMHWIQFNSSNFISYYHDHLFPSSLYQNIINFLHFYTYTWFKSTLFASWLKYPHHIVSDSHKHHHHMKCISCDLTRITCPIGTLCGSEDGLVDPYAVLKQLPTCIYNHIEPTYEHLDMIWADNVKVTIYPKILSLLEEYSQKRDMSQIKEELHDNHSTSPISIVPGTPIHATHTWKS